MSENYIVINGKKVELTEEQLKQLGIELPKNKRWRADAGEIYYFVSSWGSICDANDYYHNYDAFRYYSHNYFQTREEADKYARVLETEMLLRKYADEHNEELTWNSLDNPVWNIYYQYDDIVIESWTISKFPHTIYFSSKKIARDALEEIGEERIKEYLNYEW